VNARWMAEARWLLYWHEESQMQEVHDERTGLLRSAPMERLRSA
jgi:hypothetical protein